MIIQVNSKIAIQVNNAKLLNIPQTTFLNIFKKTMIVPQTDNLLFFNSNAHLLFVKDNTTIKCIAPDFKDEFTFTINKQKYSIYFNQIKSLFQYPTITAKDLITTGQVRQTFNKLKSQRTVFNIFNMDKQHAPHLFRRWDSFGHNVTGYYRPQLKHYLKRHPKIGKKMNLQQAYQIRQVANKYNLPLYIIRNRITRGESLSDPNIGRPIKQRGQIIVCGQIFASRKDLAEQLGVTKSCISMRLKKYGYNDLRVLKRGKNNVKHT